MKEMAKKTKLFEKVKLSRRNFLVLLLIAGGLALVGKFLIPFLQFFSRSGLDTSKQFRNFEVIDAGKEIIFKDRKGAEVLIVEKDALK